MLVVDVVLDVGLFVGTDVVEKSKQFSLIKHAAYLNM